MSHLRGLQKPNDRCSLTSALTEVLWKALKAIAIFSRAIRTANALIGSILGFGLDCRVDYRCQVTSILTLDSIPSG